MNEEGINMTQIDVEMQIPTLQLQWLILLHSTIATLLLPLSLTGSRELSECILVDINILFREIDILEGL